MANVSRTGILMTALVMSVGYLIGGSSGMAIALGIAAAMNLFAYWNAGRPVLWLALALRKIESAAQGTLVRQPSAWGARSGAAV